ncbi:type IV secretory system conjugative DNA transfer family protein [Neptunomonas phycophila]|uniref:type IV secretory system conjugative DNA transfer family protein n=1 Tax=Neptunomonas phycophila TaxID=1572645 RepID=UPI003512C267
MKAKAAALSVAIACAFLSGCASSTASRMSVPDVDSVRAGTAQWENNITLSALQSLSTDKSLKEAVDNDVLTGDGSRYQALRSAAWDLGVRGGLHARAKEINLVLQRTLPQLNKLFDFNPYMLPGNVFPPVITETNGMIEKQNRTEMRSVRHSYHILTLPTLMIEPPTFINYLVRNYSVPTLPVAAIRPSNTVEQKNWSIWVAEGWAIGRKQAEMQYESDLNRLQRDLKGIRLFHDLEARGVISMPRLAKRDFGLVKSSDGRTLSIGDEVLTIIQDSEFNGSDQWVPIIGERINE